MMTCLRPILVAVAALVVTAPLNAQPPDQRPEVLRRQVTERFLMNYRDAAGLTADQFRQFQQVATESWRRRQVLEQRERQLYRALDGQMRPGVGADTDSVAALLDGIIGVQTERVAQSERDQAAYAAFLTPVQRAQLVLMTMRFERQIDAIRHRMEPRRVP